MARALALTLALTFSAIPAALSAADRPPAHLHRVGDHWTAWDPPSDLPADAQIYTIVRGDTLWDLAGRFVGNPYLWPQLWEKNRYILDAHWIYPGDPLVTGLEVEPMGGEGEAGAGAGGAGVTGAGGAGTAGAGGEEGTSGEAAGGAAEEGAEAIGASRGPVPLGSESDIYCSGFIGPLERDFGYHLVGTEYEAQLPDLPGTLGAHGAGGRANPPVKFDLSTGDIVYLDGGRAGGLSPGAVFTVVEPQDPVRHPISHRVLGRFYRYLGRVRVLSVQDETAIAEISDACHPIQIGAALMPFEPEPVPLARRTPSRPVNFPTSAQALADAPAIVRADDQVISLGQDHVVYIDRGANDDVTPGDVYTIYRLNRRGLPPIVLGELAVLSVHESTSVAKVLESRYPVYVGDRLEKK